MDSDVNFVIQMLQLTWKVCKLILGASDADTQEYLSRLAGTYDKIVTSQGVNREAYTGINRGTSTNSSDKMLFL